MWGFEEELQVTQTRGHAPTALLELQGGEGRTRPSTIIIFIGGHYLIMNFIIETFKFINNPMLTDDITAIKDVLMLQLIDYSKFHVINVKQICLNRHWICSGLPGVTGRCVSKGREWTAWYTVCPAPVVMAGHILLSMCFVEIDFILFLFLFCVFVKLSNCVCVCVCDANEVKAGGDNSSPTARNLHCML